METKEDTDLTGRLCDFYGTTVLVIYKRIRFIDDKQQPIKVISYDVLFPDNGIDTVNSKSLKLIS